MVLESVPAEALDRATVRAQARDVSAQLVKADQAGFDGVEFFEVGSFSRPGLTHRVAIRYTAAGIETLCDCEAGQRHVLCMHVAAALQASQSIPAVESEPTPKPAMSASRFLELANGTPEDVESVYGYHAPLKRGRCN